jgi:multidrug efflux pump subunit AcrB
LMNLPVRPSRRVGDAVPLRSFATIEQTTAPASISRTTLLPTITVVANIGSRDIGATNLKVQEILNDLRKDAKPGNRIELAGQAVLMQESYSGLLSGMILAAVLVFLVMVVNFQSWALPFVSLSGLPIAIAGAAVGLFLTQTPISVPALMGVIVVVGVSTANSVLVTSFARDRLLDGETPRQAALHAAVGRLRPVLMTAGTMIHGLIPMALAFGEGGEQNAPLARAVIGGLLFGTVASLVVVPVVFDLICSLFRTAGSNDSSSNDSVVNDRAPVVSEPQLAVVTLKEATT